MNKNISIVFLILFLIFLEFFRDYLFININLQIQFTELINNNNNPILYTDSLIEQITKEFSIQQLKITKWIMTIIFFILFFGVGSIIAINLWIREKAFKFIQIYFISGLAIFTISFIFYLLSLITNLENSYNLYYISIEISHFVQSSLYPITFLLIFYSFTKMKIEAKY